MLCLFPNPCSCNRMTLTELRYIIAVAQQKHFGRAASQCFVSQPTLSIAIKKLESELGVTLFERSIKNEIQLTALGAQIVEQAQRVMEETQKIHEIAQLGQDPLNGVFRLGVIYTIGPYLLPNLIMQLQANTPQLRMIIEENFTVELVRQLKQGQLDAVIIALPVEAAGLQHRCLYREPFVIALPQKHHWKDRDQIEANELAQEDLMLLGPGHCFRDQVLQACTDCMRQTGQLDQSLQGGSLETIRHMVASGTGITVLPCSSIDKDHYSALLQLKNFAEPVPMRDVAIAWRRNFTRTEAIDVIAQAVSKTAISCVEYCNENE